MNFAQTEPITTHKAMKIRAADMEETLNITKQLKLGVATLQEKQSLATEKLKGDRLNMKTLREDFEATSKALEEYKKGYHILRAALKKAKLDLEHGQRMREMQRTKTMKYMDRMTRLMEENVRGVVFQAWILFFQKGREEKAIREMQRKAADDRRTMAHKAKATAMKFAQRTIKNNKTALMGAVFAAWRMGAHEERGVEAAAQALKASQREFKEYKEQEKEAVKAMVMRNAAHEDHLVLCSVFDFWSQHVGQAQSDRRARGILKSTEDHYKETLAKRGAEAKQVLARYITSSENSMVEGCFQMWVMSKDEQIAERNRLEESGRRVAHLITQRKSLAMQAIQKMTNSQDSLCLDVFFESWYQLVTDIRDERVKNAAAMELKMEMLHRARNRALHIEARTKASLVEECYDFWSLHYREEKRVHGVVAKYQEEVERLRSKKLEEAMAVVSKMVREQNHALCEIVYKAWDTAVHDIKRDRVDKEIRSKNEVEVMNLQTTIRDKNSELEDLTDELAESRRKNALMRKEFKEMEKSHDIMQENIEELLRDD